MFSLLLATVTTDTANFHSMMVLAALALAFGVFVIVGYLVSR